MRRSWIIGAIALVAAALLLLVDPAAVASGWRIAFLTASAPVLGAVLMLLIARVVGADWRAFDPMATATPLMLLFALAILPAQFAADVPANLILWGSPWAIAIRALLAVGALIVVANRLIRGVSVSFAAIALALYAVLVSLIAYDWMLGGDLGHPISSIGMMLTAEQVGGACAALLVLGLGSTGFRRDMSYMQIAMGLALSYMIFMDYLIKWYADLPSEVDWYVARGGPMALVASAALILWLFAPIVSLTVWRDDRGRRIAGACGLAGLWLANLWLVGGGWLAALAGAVVTIAIASWSIAFSRRQMREEAHGRAG